MNWFFFIGNSLNAWETIKLCLFLQLVLTTPTCTLYLLGQVCPKNSMTRNADGFTVLASKIQSRTKRIPIVNTIWSCWSCHAFIPDPRKIPHQNLLYAHGCHWIENGCPPQIHENIPCISLAQNWSPSENGHFPWGKRGSKKKWTKPPHPNIETCAPRRRDETSGGLDGFERDSHSTDYVMVVKQCHLHHPRSSPCS